MKASTLRLAFLIAIAGTVAFQLGRSHLTVGATHAHRISTTSPGTSPSPIDPNTRRQPS
jgi:hypothetical protein